MEPNQSSVFDLTIDQPSSAHLYSSAKWAKFLAIIGFIMCGLIVLVAVFAGTIMSTMSSSMTGTAGFGGMNATFITILYLIIVVIYFFPCLYLYNYATSMLAALAANDQDKLTRAFSQLKSCFRFLGILTIIVLAVYSLVIIFALLAVAMR